MLKKLSILCAVMFAFGLMSGSVYAQSYCQDFLEPGNPGGITTGLKTCDTVNPGTLNPGDTFAVDIWAADIPESIITSGFEMAFNPAQVSIVSVQAYDGVDITGPWDGTATLKIPDAYGPGSYALAVVQLGTCPVPDAGGDIIIAKVTFQCVANGTGNISVKGIDSFDTTVGCNSGVVYDATMGTNALSVTIAAAGCTGNEECVDTLYCNGIETCNTGTGFCEAGTAVVCNDGIDCTTDSCNEATDSCDHVPDNAVCDDGLFCNGSEICDVVNDCQVGTNPCPDDGDFCSGVESCDDVQDLCVASGNPCSAGEQCNEDTDSCDLLPCSLSIDPPSAEIQVLGTVQFNADVDQTCANDPTYTWMISAGGCTGEEQGSTIGGSIDENGLYTAGIETGTDIVVVTDVSNTDEDGNNLCATAIVSVVESTSTTTSVRPTTTTSTPTTTTTVEPTTTTTTIGPTTTTTSIPGPTASIDVRPSSVFQSRWFFLPRLLRIEGTNTNFVRRESAVTFQPANAVLKFPPLVLDGDSIVMWVIIMPRWLTGEIDSVEVTAITGSESASGELGIELLPFFLEEKQGELE